MQRLITDIIRDIDHKIVRDYVSNHVNKPKEIKNLSQARIIHYLHEHNDHPISQKELGDSLKLRKSSITEHLDHLENVSFIERVVDENDRRVHSIRLSKKAQSKEEELRNVIAGLDEKIIQNISKKDLQICEKVLLKMEENLKEVK